MDSPDPELRKNLILASAYFHAPTTEACHHANCFRVLRHALIAASLWEDRLRQAFYGDEEDSTKFPVMHEWYATLIELTRETESQRLLQGGGNLTLPAAPYYTACGLTPAGRAFAEQLLADHPDWKTRLTTPTLDPRY